MGQGTLDIVATNVIGAVRGVLEDMRPKNVDWSAVAMTGEGDNVRIVIVPHRHLGGVSLVLWTDNNGTQLRWAGVLDLSTHDDIDLGALVTQVLHEGAWITNLRDAVAGELVRPIRLKRGRGLSGNQRIHCYVTTKNKEKRLAVLRPMSLPGTIDSGPAEWTTSLAGGPHLPFSVSPPLENWHRYR